MYICISHDPRRQKKFLEQAGVEWKSIQVVKVYRPTVERETKIIREEFVSKDVLDKIDDLSRVKVYKQDEETPESPWLVVPYNEMEPFVPRKKEPMELDPYGGEPADIICYYVYICEKPYIKTPEPSEVGEERDKNDSDDEYNDYN